MTPLYQYASHAVIMLLLQQMVKPYSNTMRLEKNWICRPLPLFIAISMILKHVIFELLLLRAAFVAGEIWGDA